MIKSSHDWRNVERRELLKNLNVDPLDACNLGFPVKTHFTSQDSGSRYLACYIYVSDHDSNHSWF